MHSQKLSIFLIRAGLGFACLAIPVATTSTLMGQENPAPETNSTANSTPTAKHDFRFEVTSIRLSETGNRLTAPMPPPTASSFTSLDSVVSLAMKAFDLKQMYQIESKPWMSSSYYVINATLPEGATKDDIPLMLQHLLTERFGMVYHRETRKMDGYKLVVAKSGLKFHKSSERTPNAPVADFDASIIKDGVPQFPDSMGSIQVMTPKGAFWRGRNRTMQQLASDLSRRLGAPVTDATGLDGEFDYSLAFIPETVQLPAGIAPIGSLGTNQAGMAPQHSDSDPGAYPELSDALESELGLKLVPAKAVPVEVIVIDNALKQPTEN